MEWGESAGPQASHCFVCVAMVLGPRLRRVAWLFNRLAQPRGRVAIERA